MSGGIDNNNQAQNSGLGLAETSLIDPAAIERAAVEAHEKNVANEKTKIVASRNNIISAGFLVSGCWLGLVSATSALSAYLAGGDWVAPEAAKIIISAAASGLSLGLHWHYAGLAEAKLNRLLRWSFISA